jgi:hypothetical protein
LPEVKEPSFGNLELREILSIREEKEENFRALINFAPESKILITLHQPCFKRILFASGISKSRENGFRWRVRIDELSENDRRHENVLSRNNKRIPRHAIARKRD